MGTTVTYWGSHLGSKGLLPGELLSFLGPSFPLRTSPPHSSFSNRKKKEKEKKGYLLPLSCCLENQDAGRQARTWPGNERWALEPGHQSGGGSAPRATTDSTETPQAPLLEQAGVRGRYGARGRGVGEQMLCWGPQAGPGA